MRRQSTVFAALLATVSWCVAPVCAAERDALESLYAALSGEGWERNEGWVTDAPLAQWRGVTVSGGRVVEIKLAGNRLMGELPDDLGGLPFLRALDLRWNALWGEIPESIAEFSSLESLLLSGNEFTGPIPESLGSLPALRRLDLSYNRLYGTIPSSLGNLLTLQTLGLHHNLLTGHMPAEVARIGSLQRLILKGNDLFVPTAPEFERLRNDVHMQVSDSGRPYTDSVDSFNGLDLLSETTMVIDAEALPLVREAMAGVVVRDGELDLDAPALRRLTHANELRHILAGINQRLREAGERIEHVGDLDRALELYASGTITLPDPPPPVPRLLMEEGRAILNQARPSPVEMKTRPKAVDGSVEYVRSVSMDRTSLRGPGPYRSGMTMAPGVTAIVDQAGIEPPNVAEYTIVFCRKFRAHNPHQSDTDTSEVVGKGELRCSYRYGPPQLLSYTAVSFLQRQRGWWLFRIWRVVGTYGQRQKFGNDAFFPQYQLVAAAPCVGGTYRTMLALWVTGSVAGPFFPYPAITSSRAESVSC